MRMFATVQFEGEPANRAIKDGSIGKTIERFVGETNPEGMWFTLLNGKRTMVAVFDLKDAAQMPKLAEPLFTGLNAAISLSPAMDLAELQSGLSAI